MNALSPLLQTLTSVAAQVAEMERQIDELTQTTIEQKARIENYEDLLRRASTPNEQRGALGLPPLGPDRPVTPGLWLLAHRGDPCVYCKTPMEEVGVGGCPVTIQQLYSRIGEVADEEQSLMEGGHAVEARRKNEEARRLRRLHEVLTYDFGSAGVTP